MLTIYNTTVPVTSQEQVDRLKQACVDYGLEIYLTKGAFDCSNRYQNYLCFEDGGFYIKWHDSEPTEPIITESEWMELLTQSQPKL